MHRLSSALLLSVLLLVAGCNTGSRSSSKSASTAAPATSTTAPGTTNAGPPSASASTVALAASEARMGTDVVALVLNVTASGSGTPELGSVTVQASGTVDESQALGEVKLVHDANGNGQLDQGEAVLASAAAPAFSADDGSLTLTLATPAPISGSLQLLVTVDASALGAVAASRIGETVALSVATAGDLTITSGGQALVPGGSFPLAGGPVTLFVHDHLLISELVSGFGDAYVELFNPTTQAIDLSGYFLSDTDDYSAPKVKEYYNVPTGANFESSSAYDAIVRFPAGATLAPGAYAVMALDGIDFQTAYGQAPDYCARNPVGGAQQMLTPDTSTPANWVAAPVGTGVYFFWSGEPLVLFFWDGQSDLVQDVDYLYMGSVITSASGDPHDKTGVQVDGPDADTTPSAFVADTAATQQATLAGQGPWQRVDYTEAGEVTSGGNGITGDDETSEPVNLTFTTATTPTPGAP